MTLSSKGNLGRLLFASVFVLFGLDTAHAQCVTDINGKTLCPPPESSCIRDRYGAVVCAPSKGSIIVDRYGEPVCGPGACARTLQGDFACSSSAGGSAAIDLHAKAVCTDGCTPAVASLCVRPR